MAVMRACATSGVAGRYTESGALIRGEEGSLLKQAGLGMSVDCFWSQIIDALYRR
jgi:hypothetical protein